MSECSRITSAPSLYVGVCAALLAGCAMKPLVFPAPAPTPAPVPAPVVASDPHVLIERSLPRALSDRAGWVGDIYGAFAALSIEPTPERVCAVVAVIEQESDFQIDPQVPDLGAIAAREIDRRAERAGVPLPLVHGVLQLKSANGHSYSERIAAARTEKDLSDIYEDFIASVPLGRTLFAERNPIRTRGPMQVNIAFAERYAATKPYPYPVQQSIDDEVFTRRGSLYFGIAHLLDYPAPYNRYLYRFADFNAGQYASRNAAFQSALSTASGLPLTADGALLAPDGETDQTGSTEAAARVLGRRLDLSERALHSALEEGKASEFERTALYQRVFALAEKSAGHPLPRALVPRITLQGPKLTRHLTTDWYARRVNERYTRCLNH
jgi:hypothetical protein